MDNTHIPKVFGQLQANGCIGQSDILRTQDGFWMVYKSLSDILSEKDIYDFPTSHGERLACNRFFDDWFLYAIENKADCTYSLLKLREQEHDAEDGSPADGDTPGVTISFIDFKWNTLLECLADPSDENRMRLDAEINRVVARRGQHHHACLKQYFLHAASEGSYLVATTYVRHIASFSKNGILEVPLHYKEIAKQSVLHPNSRQLARLPHFIASVNQAAGYTVCDNEQLYIKDPENLTSYEAAAILATHTGNTSLHSFAAEVEYHARFLIPAAKMKIPFLGKSIYASAIRADMSVGDAEFQGPAPFYRADSRIVKRQYALHPHKQL